MAASVEIEIIGRDSFSGTLSNFGNILTGIKSAIDLVADGFRAFTDFAMEGLDAIASYERMGTSFEALAASQMMMTGAANDMNQAYAMTAGIAEELLDWSQQLAIHSPFTQEGVAEALRMAMAYGFNVDEAKRLTEAMINYTSASGQSEAAMSRIALALGQISATGKVTGQDILQLTNVGVPAMQILADHFGVSTAEIMKMREQGLIPAEEAIEAITVWMETNFAGAAAKFSESWAGLMGTFDDLKAMGLREFFGGLAEALQPVVVAFAEWVQGPGMVLIGTLGDMLGNLAATNIDNLKELAPIFNTINLAILEFSNLIENDWAPLDALNKVLGDLAIVWKDTPLEGIVTEIQTFIQTGQTEGWGEAIKELLSGLFENLWGDFDAQSKVQELVDLVADAIPRTDWSAVGATLAQVLSNAISGALRTLHFIVDEIDWQPLGDALRVAFTELLTGFWNNIDWSRIRASIWDVLSGNIGEWLKDNWIKLLLPAVPTDAQRDMYRSWFRDVAADMVQGLSDGMASLRLNIDQWVQNKIINPVKQFLGIASPSTVFMQIGRDIVQGLIDGVGAMWQSFVTFIETKLNNLLDGLGIDNIMDALTGQGDIIGVSDTVDSSSGLGAGTSPGTIGGGTGTGPPPGSSTLTGSGGVTNMFYGPVYFNGLSQLGYDCPSPHPLLTASGQSLLTTTLG